MKARCTGRITVLSIPTKTPTVRLTIKTNITITGLVTIPLGSTFIVKSPNMLVRTFFDNFKVNKWMHDRMLFNRFAVTPQELYKFSLTPRKTPPFGSPNRKTTMLVTFTTTKRIASFTGTIPGNSVEKVNDSKRTTYLTAVTVHPKLNRTARPIVPSITLNKTRIVFRTSESRNTLPPLTKIVSPRCRTNG